MTVDAKLYDRVTRATVDVQLDIRPAGPTATAIEFRDYTLTVDGHKMIAAIRNAKEESNEA